MARTPRKRTDYFENAPTLEVPERDRRINPRVVLRDVADLAALSRVIAEFGRAYEVVDSRVREHATQYFVTNGCDAGSRPENIRAVEPEDVDGSSVLHAASVELRARGAGSPLTDQAIDLCAQYNLPVDPLEKRPAAFMINPECLKDPGMMEKIKTAINEALNKIPDLPPDPIVFQTAETSSIATDATLDAMFALRNPKLARQILPLISSTSVKKCVFDSPPGRDDIFARAMRRASDLLQNETFRLMMRLFAEQRTIEARMARRKPGTKG